VSTSVSVGRRRQRFLPYRPAFSFPPGVKRLRLLFSVERGRKAISIERQVRIVAGSLVALGIALGAFISPWFLLISGFVGMGLVFAGITDSYAMGMLLASMPWNRAPEALTCAAPSVIEDSSVTEDSREVSR
jgi:hypothetical protein